MDDQKKQVTPLATVAAGAAALAVGGLAGGMSHYHGTRKQLIEEGIDPRARLRALPIAVRRNHRWCRALLLAAGTLTTSLWL